MAEPQRNSQRTLRLGYLNSVILLGRLTADADLRYTPRGTPVCTFRIAVNRRFLNKETGEWQDEANYFTVTVWAQQAERLGEKLKKGAAVLVQGELRSNTWDTSSGEKRTTVEIYGRNVQVLGQPPAAESEEVDSSPPADEEPDIPKDQLDDIPF